MQGFRYLRKKQPRQCGSHLYPTILDLTNTEPVPKQHLDGDSLLPVQIGGGTIKDRPLYLPHYGDFGCSPFSAVRYNDWKLYRYYNNFIRCLSSL